MYAYIFELDTVDEFCVTCLLRSAKVYRLTGIYNYFLAYLSFSYSLR